MCSLFANTAPIEAMRSLFDTALDASSLGNAQPVPAVRPRGLAPVLRRSDDSELALTPMSWGFLLPQVSKRTGRPIQPKAVNNARDDKLRASPFWRESFERRRCLIPLTAFCEPKGRAPAEWVWFALRGRQPRPPVAAAGLWRRWRGRMRDEAVDITVFTMVTTRPNALVAEVHPDRMPALLRPDQHAPWLLGDCDEAFAQIAPFPADAMRIARRGVDDTSDPVWAG